MELCAQEGSQLKLIYGENEHFGKESQELKERYLDRGMATSVGSTLVHFGEIFHQLLDSLPQNVVQTFMVPI